MGALSTRSELMTQKTFRFFLGLTLTFFSIAPGESALKFEGHYGSSKMTPEEITEGCQRIVSAYFPYNAIIVDAGASTGENTEYFAKNWPLAKIIVFEPNPTRFNQLQKNLAPYRNVIYCNAGLHLYSGNAILHVSEDTPIPSCSFLEKPQSHLNSSQESTITVPCVVLDDWCRNHKIDHIHCLHLDTEGFEMQVLQGSPEILKTILVIWTKTNFSKSRVGTTQFPQLSAYLESQGFILMSHWHEEEGQGDAIFLRDYLYDAVFK